MDSSAEYLVGLDGLPLGDLAAIAHDGKVTSVFELLIPYDRTILRRVQSAVRIARWSEGSLPSEIRILLVDDGGAGQDIDDTRQWLHRRGRIELTIVDPAGVRHADIPILLSPEELADPEAMKDRSRARAKLAALGSA